MAIVSLHKILQQQKAARSAAFALNPRLLHIHRIQVAATRAALDVLAENISAPDVWPGADLQHQRRQIQADWLGYEQMEAQDTARQGLLRETRTSLAEMDTALSAAQTAPQADRSALNAHLLLALERLNRALTDDSGFLQQDAVRATAHTGRNWAAWAWLSLALLVALGAAALAAPRDERSN
jgi:hypothetical protein